MERAASEADWGNLSWHDDTIYSLNLQIGDPARGDWRSDLVLDIDYIVAWLCGAADGTARFRVAPATLTFHNVTDLRIAVDLGDSGHRVALRPLSIDSIARERIDNQQICLDRALLRVARRAQRPARRAAGVRRKRLLTGSESRSHAPRRAAHPRR